MGIFDLFSDGNEKKAAAAQKAGLRAGQTAAYGQIDQGQGQYDQFANQALAGYKPYADISLGGANTYADSLGINGGAGNDRAVSAFQTGPGYDFARDEAMQAVERSASASGYLGAGNLGTALQDRANGLANQEYGGWQDRLAGLMGQGVNIAGATGAIQTGQGANAMNNATNKAQIGWNTATGQGQADAEYQKSKDQSGANIFNGVMGLLKLGAGA